MWEAVGVTAGQRMVKRDMADEHDVGVHTG